MGCADDFCVETTWETILWPVLLIPLLFTISLSVVTLLTQRVLSRTEIGRYYQHAFERDATDRSDAILFGIQLIFSASTTVIWVQRTYAHKVTEASRLAEVILSIFYVLHYVWKFKSSGFSYSYPLTYPACIDVFTVLPVIAWLSKPAHRIPWLSLGYLRIKRCVVAYDMLVGTGILDDVSEMKKAYAHVTLKAFSLVILLGGTVMFLEVLGDPSALQYTPVETEMGELSFVQMFYWIITTITTVGYGDYSPRTVLSQIFVIFCIVYGVLFFSIESAAVLDLKKLEDTGLGRFRPKKGSKHVVLVGGGVVKISSVVAELVNQLYQSHEGHEHDMPDCAMMAPTTKSDSMRSFLGNLPACAKNRVHYFVGSVMDKQDLERIRVAQASLVIIVCDVQTPDPDAEDRENTMRAVSLKRHIPHVNLRLLLLRPESKHIAVRMGIRSARCLSINELKTSLLALSTHCLGYTTLIANLVERSDHYLPDVAKKELPHWAQDYYRSLETHFIGFCVADHMVNKAWTEFVEISMLENITPLAVQLHGRVTLNPTFHRFNSKDIVFAIISDVRRLVRVADLETDWRIKFREEQDKAPSRISDSTGLKEEMRASGGSQCSQLPAEVVAPSRFHLHTGGHSQPESIDKTRLAPFVQFPRGLAKKKPTNTSNSARHKTEDPRTPVTPSNGKVKMQVVGDLLKSELEDLDLEADEITAKGGHIVLIVLAGSIWQQVHTFIERCRGRHLPYHPPIIVVSSRAPSRDIRHDICSFGNVGILLCRALKPSDISRANIEMASGVILLAGRPLADDWRMVDCNGIMMLTTLEGDNASCPKVLELLNEDSAGLLTLYPPSPNISKSSYSGATLKFDRPLMQLLTDHGVEISFNHLPRFAAGNLFSTSCVGAMCGLAYYVPGVLELTEALALGTGQLSFPWQVQLPASLDGKSFADLVAWTLKGFPEEAASVPDEVAGFVSIPIGIFRSANECDEDTDHVIPNPPMDFRLRGTDLAFVLGSAQYVRACVRKGYYFGLDDMDSQLEYYTEKDSNRQGATDAENFYGFDPDRIRSTPAPSNWRALLTGKSEP